MKLFQMMCLFTEVDGEIHQVTKDVIVKSTNGSGTSTGKQMAQLTIKKYDREGDKEAGINKEAHFQLES